MRETWLARLEIYVDTRVCRLINPEIATGEVWRATDSGKGRLEGVRQRE